MTLAKHRQTDRSDVIMNSPTTTLWEEIKAAYRRSCDLARAGEAAASSEVLREEVLPRFSEWSRRTDCGVENRRLFIENLMRQERRRVQSAWVKHHVGARDRRRNLENAIKQERRELQREWAIQSDIGQQLNELSVNLPAPMEINAPPIPGHTSATAEEQPDRLPIDDVPNIIDFVLQEQANHTEESTAHNKAVA